ncbi:UTP--glucose-1-phosphate uridylyltransferase [soil metagenome]
MEGAGEHVGELGPDAGSALIRETMRREGIGQAAIDTFEHHYRVLVGGATGMMPESTIVPYEMPALRDQHVPPSVAEAAVRSTAVIKLNGGLGTSMGLDRAKSLLRARDDLTFLDMIARQLLALRREWKAPLPITFLHSFRTSADSLEALAAYPELAVPGISLEVLQNRVPKLRADDLTPVRWPPDPALEWCPPGHGDLYPVLYATGLLEALLEAGCTQAFVSNSDNLGAVPDPHVAGWFAQSGAPFAVEAVRRTASDRKGGHFARRRRDGRVILRESAQTPAEDQAAMADLALHRYASTNNLWFDLAAMRAELEAHRGVLELPLIKNVKTVDPADPASPPVVQLETAMGAAIQLFEGAQTIEVGRDRFIPVKTTDDLLVLRSDCYRMDEDCRLHQTSTRIPFVELGAPYKLVDDFERRFPDGVPSMLDATALVVRGDWTFGAGVRVVGAAELGPDGGSIPPHTVLGGTG